MKKITLCLFIVSISTSVLFAQTKGLTKTVDSQTLQLNKNAPLLEVLKVQNSEMSTTERVQTRSQDSEIAMMELSAASQANNDLTMKKRLKENEVKSDVAEEERDNLSAAINNRLEKSEKNTSTLEKRNLVLEKQRIDLEKRREIARKKAMQSYVAPSSTEVADKKSNQQNK
jgi:Na+-transporting NADH:ubiquinone oxidoreductase subunit NqrC